MVDLSIDNRSLNLLTPKGALKVAVRQNMSVATFVQFSPLAQLSHASITNISSVTKLTALTLVLRVFHDCQMEITTI